MSKRSPDNNGARQASAEQDAMASIKRIQQQLAFLEKKIDILITQTQPSSLAERRFFKPLHSISRPHRHSAGEHDAGYGERNRSRKRHFEKYGGESTHRFDYERKAYDTSYGNELGAEHHFKNRQSGTKRTFKQEAQPFYHRRKKRG